VSDWKKISVASQASLRETMRIIDQGALQIALVVDPQNHLLGTVTDGDIRRALLRDVTLDSPISEVMNTHPTTGLQDEQSDSWQRTMQRHSLRSLPILDAQGNLIDVIHYQPPNEPRRETPVILMAGGLGTRLRPLTENMPKPLLSIGSKPILQSIIENLASQGFYRFYIAINYKGDMIQDYFKDGSQWGVQIDYLEENKRLGTAGALSLLPSTGSHAAIVMNSDLLTKVDFVRLMDFHHQHDHQATVCVREYQHQIPYGVVELDEHQVTAIVEKPIQRHYISAGIYVLEPHVIQQIPSNQFYDMPELLQQLLSKQQKVGSFPIREYWIDIGRMEEFERANDEFHAYYQNR